VLTTIATWLTGRVVDRLGASRLFWPTMVLGAVSVVGVATAPWLWLVAVSAWLRCVPTAVTSTGLYAHLAQVVPRNERAAVMTLTPLPRNVAQFFLPLIAAGAASFGTTVALLVGAIAYAAAAWVGRLMQEATHRHDEDKKGEAPLGEAPP
jgi:MFS family permease